MDQASSCLASCSTQQHRDRRRPPQPPRQRVVVHLELQPGQTVSWRVVADSEIRAHGSRIWLTRVGFPYDYWMQPGDVLRVKRGERVWISSDGDGPGEVAVASDYRDHRSHMNRWLSHLKEIIVDLSFLRAR
jgi:Protein of unknown function (DUF2917)